MSKKKYKSTGSRKPDFNTGLYEKNRYDPAKDNSHNEKMAGIIYRVCAALFAVMMLLTYASGDMQNASLYLLLMLASVGLIYFNSRKSGGNRRGKMLGGK